MRFDRSALASRPNLGLADFLYESAAQEIAERSGFTTRRFANALYSGPALPSVFKFLSGAAGHWTVASPQHHPGVDVVADLALPFRSRFDLAVSLNDLHLADHPVRALAEIRGALAADGLFLGAVPATGTLGELTDALVHAEASVRGGASMRVAPLADVRSWGDAVARAGFALPVADEVRLTVRYPTLGRLMDDLKHMGMRRVLAERHPAPRALFHEAEVYYRAQHADSDGRLRATFVLAYLSGWSPDPSQQKPARRGSATMSLEDALKRFGG